MTTNVSSYKLSLWAIVVGGLLARRGETLPIFSAPYINTRSVTHTRLAQISSCSSTRCGHSGAKPEGLTLAGLHLVSNHFLVVVVVRLGSGRFLDPRRSCSVGRGARILRPDRDASRLA